MGEHDVWNPLKASRRMGQAMFSAAFTGQPTIMEATAPACADEKQFQMASRSARMLVRVVAEQDACAKQWRGKGQTAVGQLN